MKVVDAHKSSIEYVTTVTGREAHSSMPQLGANAVFAAAELAGELDRYRAGLVAAGDPSGRFDPPSLTIQVVTIEGGTATNIVPRKCAQRWNVRAVCPASTRMLWSLASSPSRTRSCCRGYARRHRKPRSPPISSPGCPSLAPEPGSEAEVLALRLAGQNRTYTVAYGTEGGHFQSQGIPCVICGPGSIDQAHKPDEFIEVSEPQGLRALPKGVITVRERGHG